MSQCTCTTDKEATCIVHPTVRSLKEYIEASQNLLRASNKRIDQLENEKSLMAKYMGRLEATIAELKAERAGQVMLEVEAGTNEANIRAKLIELGWAPPELREAARAVVDNAELKHGGCGSSYIVNQQRIDALAALLEKNDE